MNDCKCNNSISGEILETIDAIKQALPLELTKIWGRSHNNIDKHELIDVYNFFDGMINNRNDY